MENQKANNLEEAVLQQLELQDIYPVVNVTAEFFNEKTYTTDRLAQAVGIALKSLGVNLEKSKGIAPEVIGFLKRRKSGADTLTGKQV